MSARDALLALKARMAESIVGQETMIERLLLGLLANGNLLVARNLDAQFSRIQFTPDLLPADITGWEVDDSESGKGEFKLQPGPVFANLVLADEVNRAPAKVQAAHKKDDETEEGPNEKPDQIQFDDQGKKGKVGEMRNIQTTPRDLLRRKFAIAAHQGSSK